MSEGVWLQLEEAAQIQFTGQLDGWPAGVLNCEQWTEEKQLHCRLPVESETFSGICPFVFEGAVRCIFEANNGNVKMLLWDPWEESFFTPLSWRIHLQSSWSDESFLRGQFSFLEKQDFRRKFLVPHLGVTESLFQWKNQDRWVYDGLEESSEFVRPGFYLRHKGEVCQSFFFTNKRWGETCGIDPCFGTSFLTNPASLTDDLLLKLETRSQTLVDQLKQWSKGSSSSLDAKVHLHGLFWWLWHLVRLEQLGSQKALDPFLSFFPESLQADMRQFLFDLFEESCLPVMTWDSFQVKADVSCDGLCQQKRVGPFQGGTWPGGLRSFEWRQPESHFLALLPNFHSDWNITLSLWGLPPSWGVSLVE